MAEIPLPVEPTSPGRNFEDIQNELYSYKNSPDPTKERDLRIERARLINEAKEVGVFGTMKRHMLDIETNNPSLTVSATLIDSIDAGRMEDEARVLRGWDDRFEGLLSAYKDGSLRNLGLAYLRKTNASPPEIANAEREIDLLNWGTPPALVGTLPIEPELSSKQFGFTARELALENAKAQGIPPLEQDMRNYIEAEDYLTAPFQINPGQEPRFWVLLNEKEKLVWYVRSTLETAAYKKSVAANTEDLYMDKMKDFAVGLNKRYLKILLGSRKETGEVEFEGVEGVLPAVGIYATIIGDRRFLDYNSAGDLSLKDVFCNVLTSTELQESLGEDYGSENLSKLQTQQDELYKSCTDSMYPHDASWGTPINQESFRKLRESIRFWLTTKGRDLLLTDEEQRNRADFFRDKNKAYETIQNRSRDAEQMAWNFVYTASLLESFDSRDYRPAGTKRHGPSNYWTLFQWTPMHLQERFEQKIVRSNNSPDAEAKEEWAGNLGTWAVNNLPRWSSRLPDGSVRVNFPRILPDTLIRSALFNYADVYRVGRDATGRPKEQNDDGSFFGIFNKIGNEVLFHTENVRREDIESRIDWDSEKIPDSPFVPFIYDEMRWLNDVQVVFKKGQEGKVGMDALSEAVRNLRLTREQKENLLKVYFGVNPKASNLTYAHGSIGWGGVLSGVRAGYPNYFLDR